VVKDHPNIPALDIMKEVGRIWQNITKDELDYFKEKSRKDMERYLKEHEKFINEINDLRAKSKPDLSGSNSNLTLSLSQPHPFGITDIEGQGASGSKRCPHRSDNHTL